MKKIYSETNNDIWGSMVHDLQSVFVGITIFSNLIKTRSDEKELVEEYANLIKKNSDDSLDMLKAYLDSLRFEKIGFRLKLESWDMNKRMSSILKLVKPIAKEKTISINVDYFPKSADLDMDRLKFKRVLFNLLSNAIKFTPRGGQIFISINNTTDNIEVSISDTGIGISKRLLPHIFDRFTKASREGTEKEKSIGIGLWTTKKIVELHGGQISVKSKVNKGTKFEINIPKKQSTVPNKTYT
jgi:two-component system phosphate regulon sensor histidine kinase PhoR